jgi:cardiolipin synthase
MERSNSSYSRLPPGRSTYICLWLLPGRLEQVPDGDSEFEKRVYEDHKRMLNELSPYVYIRSADHFHAKVVLADPFSDSSSGVLLTANLTTDALERNEELAVVLSPDQAREIASVLKCVFWEEAGHHAMDDRLSTVSGLNMIPAPGDLSGVYYNSNSANTLKDRVRTLIQHAEREIVISTFGIDENHELFSLLLKKLEQGVRVKLFARFRRGKMNAVFQALVNAGAEVYGFYWLHAKAFLIDGTTGFLMTANLEPHGMDSGFELGVDLSDADTLALAELFTEWETKHQYRYHSTIKLGDLSDRYYQYDSGRGQYDKKELKPYQELDPLRKRVNDAKGLDQSSDDFDSLLPKAKTANARRVKLTVEKVLLSDKT